jgi:hypothetical protein
MQILLAIALATVTALAAQDPEIPVKKGPAKKGDTVVIRGCVSGALLDDMDAKSIDTPTGLGGTAVTYRMTGDKKMLQILKKEHNGHVEMVTGVLKSDPGATPLGKQMGKTRITIGAGPTATSPAMQTPYYPVLEVKSFEHSGTTCR